MAQPVEKVVESVNNFLYIPVKNKECGKDTVTKKEISELFGEKRRNGAKFMQDFSRALPGKS